MTAAPILPLYKVIPVEVVEHRKLDVCACVAEKSEGVVEYHVEEGFKLISSNDCARGVVEDACCSELPGALG